MRNARNPKEIGSANELNKLRNNQEDMDLQAILSSEQGRRFLYRLLGMAGIYRNHFDADPGVMAANCGASNLGLMVLSEMQRVDPESYVTMLKERIASEQRDAVFLQAQESS